MEWHHFEGISHRRLHRARINFDCTTTLPWLDAFLRCTPTVEHFSLKVTRSYKVFSFVELHRILTERLPNLSAEHFRFKYCCLPKPFKLAEHRNIGPLFKSMTCQTYSSHGVVLLTISVNWEDDERTVDDDERADDDDESYDD